MVGDGANLAVDANGRFTLDEARAYADALAPYGLRWYEEPLDPLDYAAHATLAERYAPPLATGENLFSMQDARNLIRHGGLRPDRDVLQFDPALSYGLVEYLRTLDMLARHGWSARRCVPHGGHQFALNIAVGLGLGGNESYPDVFAPFGGFADDCPVENSLVRLPDIPASASRQKPRSIASCARSPRSESGLNQNVVIASETKQSRQDLAARRLFRASLLAMTTDFAP